MLSLEEAQHRVLAPMRAMPAEWVSLNELADRVLAADLLSRREQPPMDVSAMDGFAVRTEDCLVGAKLRVKGEIRAGATPSGQIGCGETMRIFTGAAVPDGADAILIQENATQSGTTISVIEAPLAGQFIRPRGLDFGVGDIGFSAGHRADPRTVGLAAAYGHAWLQVRRKPRVGLLATGNELTRPGDPTMPGMIISSNTPSLMAMLRSWGAEPVDLGIAPDHEAGLIRCLEGAAGLDLLVTSGGASVGDYDLIRPVMIKLGLSLDFWKIAMRPGKPLIFGEFKDMPFLGLPGNPVSAAVCAIMFLRPMILAMLATPDRLENKNGLLTTALDANDQRKDFLRAQTERRQDGQVRVTPIQIQDSSMFNTFALVDALGIRPPLDPPKRAGDSIEFIDLAEALSN